MEIRGHALVQGASRGLGLELARQLAARAAVESVTATCREPETAEPLRALARSSHGRVFVEQLDVADERSIATASSAVRSRIDRLHLLMNVAGILHGPGVKPERQLRDVEPAALDRVFAVNAFGPLLVAKHFASLLAHSEPAVLANLSARVGSIGDNRRGGWYAYRASKAAQNQLTKGLSIELQRKNRNIVVIALHPGTVDTQLSEPFQRGVKPEKLFSPERAARQLLEVIEGLDQTANGGFFAWDGQPIEW